jgi:hypothetical protein
MAMTRTFTTSRLLQFCTVAELTKLVGFGPVQWPVVVVKELIDDALDAAEDVGIAPEITIAVSTKNNTISVTGNAGGIPADAVTRLLDYTKKTSKPTSAQPEAHKAMPCSRCWPWRSLSTAAVARLRSRRTASLTTSSSVSIRCGADQSQPAVVFGTNRHLLHAALAEFSQHTTGRSEGRNCIGRHPLPVAVRRSGIRMRRCTVKTSSIIFLSSAVT